ncbi:MAG: 4-hydroxythreonine-4-phosphate dehydrogenase PdxA [Deltaproteobacteria bacterium]|nr:4-hydroxythreonine-4-phosphate dehydrogenase PdxA [Deltaproteobacteria bacterium]
MSRSSSPSRSGAGPLVVGVTMGHPSGIGPEVVVKSLCDASAAQMRVVVFGDAAVLERAAASRGLSRRFRRAVVSGLAGIVEVSALRERESRPGAPSEAGSLAQVDYIKEAVAWALDGRVAALSTAPISKAGMQTGGCNFPGHTELLARLAGVNDTAMMFAGRRLRVVLVTTHVPLSDVPAILTRELILRRLRLAARGMRVLFRSPRPRVGVAALNPHGGEDGRIGREEVRVIAPAVEAARKEGIDASGPHPADTLFFAAMRGGFDLALAMYHDQAMIAVKSAGIGRSVNITLGLPFVRTSPDHGTAFDIAAKGRADAAGMARAIRAAAGLAPRLCGKDPWTA